MLAVIFSKVNCSFRACSARRLRLITLSLLFAPVAPIAVLSAAQNPPQGVWKKSPVWKGDQSGPKGKSGFKDKQFISWNHPSFDDASWNTVSLPDRGLDNEADDRYYRSHFTWDGASQVRVHFEADDGLSIYINGKLLGSYGKGWRQVGCVNAPCGPFTESQPDASVLPSMLRIGDNVIAVDLWNGAFTPGGYSLNIIIRQEKGAKQTGGLSPPLVVPSDLMRGWHAVCEAQKALATAMAENASDDVKVKLSKDAEKKKEDTTKLERHLSPETVKQAANEEAGRLREVAKQERAQAEKAKSNAEFAYSTWRTSVGYSSSEKVAANEAEYRQADDKRRKAYAEVESLETCAKWVEDHAK